MIDLLKNNFNIHFTESIKRKPTYYFMPTRRTIHSIYLNSLLDHRNIIDLGVEIYDKMKEKFETENVLYFSEDGVEREFCISKYFSYV